MPTPAPVAEDSAAPSGAAGEAQPGVEDGARSTGPLVPQPAPVVVEHEEPAEAPAPGRWSPPARTPAGEPAAGGPDEGDARRRGRPTTEPVLPESASSEPAAAPAPKPQRPGTPKPDMEPSPARRKRSFTRMILGDTFADARLSKAASAAASFDSETEPLTDSMIGTIVAVRAATPWGLIILVAVVVSAVAALLVVLSGGGEASEGDDQEAVVTTAVE